MNTATAANEYRQNIGRDTELLDAFDEEYRDDEPGAVMVPAKHCPTCRCYESRRLSGIRKVVVNGKVKEFAGSFQV